MVFQCIERTRDFTLHTPRRKRKQIIDYDRVRAHVLLPILIAATCICWLNEWILSPAGRMKVDMDAGNAGPQQ